MENKTASFETLISMLMLCLRFFSRLPLPDFSASVKSINQPEKLSDAVIIFAPTGLVIALFPALMWWISSLFLPPVVAATLAILTGILITGALHEDGLADFADGFGGGGSREQTLKIMRDSQIGTYGAIALSFSIILRIAVLASFAPWLGVFALLIAHSSARASISIALHLSHYTRHEGLGDAVKEGISQNSFYVTLAVALVIGIFASISVGIFGGLFAMLIGFGVSWTILEYSDSRLGGYTGDVLGAMEQMAEISIMIALAAFWL